MHLVLEDVDEGAFSEEYALVLVLARKTVEETIYHLLVSM